MMQSTPRGGSFKGKKNVYKCDGCGKLLVTVDRDDGTTPFMIRCRATTGCTASMISACYRVPQELEPSHHWIRLTDEEATREGHDGQRHHHLGGLFLRAIDVEKKPDADAWPERMRYVGVLALLCECAPHVTDELRDQIEQAMIDACADGRLTYRRTLHRFDIEPAVPAC